MADYSEKSLQSWWDLEGKVVMVTGASSSIGHEICLNLAKASCNIVVAARRTDRLKSLCEEINQSNSSSSDPNANTAVRSVAIELDVSANGSIIEASVQKAWEAFGRIDALVNNAGIRGGVSSPLDLSEEEWNNVFATNLRGSWLVSKSVGRRMRDENQKGSIINVSPLIGLNHGQLPGGIAYASSKAALNNLTKVLALELGEYNIRVNSIFPGLFKSEISEKLVQKYWLNDVVLKTYPLKTYGTVDRALTSLVRYLIHDSSGYVTGNLFIVDAGAILPGAPIYSSL